MRGDILEDLKIKSSHSYKIAELETYKKNGRQRIPKQIYRIKIYRDKKFWKATKEMA
jgi:hypothetical protein